MSLGVLYERCGGIDIHKKTGVVAVDVPGHQELRTYATDTAALLALADWLVSLDVRDVAMEATASYWKPVYNVLDAAGIRVTLGNPSHIKGLPGRKTDASDAEWICDLHRHGLIRASLVPPRAQRELRELIGYRTSLIRERANEANRIAKVLEGANLKLGSVVTDILGKSGRAMLEAIASGTDDPETLAAMARGRLQRKHDDLVAALHGRINPHQRQMLRMQLGHVAFLDEQIAALDAEVATRVDPFRKEIERLDTIPGVGLRTAEVVVAQCGVDMSRFPNADHLTSWSGMAPGSHESGGKRRNTRTRKGNQALRAALTEAGQAAGRTKGTYLSALYRRIASRRGGKKAAIAVGRHILEISYYMLRDGVDYRELGANYYDERRKSAVLRTAVKRLERLGYKVTVEAA
jgi:transposase